ncbi:MAG: nucleoside recognition domain-containing protein [Christensenellales bacterium]
MSKYIIPVLIIMLILYSMIKKNNTYNSFVIGAKSSFDVVLTSFPYIVTIFIAVEIFNVSGLAVIFSDFVAPFFEFFGVPKELAQLVILKNFTGCGSLALLENIFTTYGVDSYLARAGCCIAGCSEAIFYVTAVYFSKTKVTKFRYAIPVGVIANFAGAVVSCWICRIM